MGHRVPNHKSKCRNLHGHRYVIEAGIDDSVITVKGSSNEGMVIDYGDIKQIMMEEIDDVYDHSFTMYDGDVYATLFRQLKSEGQKINFVPFVPTAENLARHWYSALEGRLSEIDISLEHLKVWETPNSTATYTKYTKRLDDR